MLSNLGACFPPEGTGAQGSYRAFKNVTFLQCVKNPSWDSYSNKV